MLKGDEEEKNILQTVKRRKANWFGHTLLVNCLLQHVIEGKIEEGTSDWKKWKRILLDGLKEKRGYVN